MGKYRCVFINIYIYIFIFIFIFADSIPRGELKQFGVDGGCYSTASNNSCGKHRTGKGHISHSDESRWFGLRGLQFKANWIWVNV